MIRISENLSPWWRRGVLLTVLVGFTVLIWIAVKAGREAPPIPHQVVGTDGEVIFTGDDIRKGQEVFLKYGLMENGTVWGHGGYLGPDFSAEYLHTLGQDTAQSVSRKLFGREVGELSPLDNGRVFAEVRQVLRENRYSPLTGRLAFTEAEVASFENQIAKWTKYFVDPTKNGGLSRTLIGNPEEIKKLTAFFAWTAWASIANRPGRDYSYTNNFPYEPELGNRPTSSTILWSAISLITLLAGTALVLFVFGKFDYLGWKGRPESIEPGMRPGEATDSQRATVKFCVVASLLFLAQVLVGGALGHYRADPGTFYGLDLSSLLPSNILRTWHLQLAIFWIATSYVAGGLMLSIFLGGREPKGQTRLVNLLFWALVLVVGGSLLGEYLGINQLMGRLWFWFGEQGWEYLDLGRGWQVLLAIGLLFWVFLLYRGIKPALADEERSEISWLFLFAGATIPVFYLPAFFFGSSTNFTVADNWRFWIIHLWVEGFFELFVTVMVAVIFHRLGVVSRQTAARVIYLDVILFLGAGIIGTGHHWYWTGQTTFNLSLSAIFSAMEVVPLTLLTLDAWDFMRLTRLDTGQTKKAFPVPHKWAFYFLMAVGFWNFVGAGIFGFLINLPIVSYFEVGTMLTPNHGHAALMGAFGMEAVALMILVYRQVLGDHHWSRLEKYVRVSFWGLNIGLAMMLLGSLFPGGVLQFYDVLTNGYWHARGQEYLSQNLVRTVEWLRMPGDLVFIVLGAIPLVITGIRTYRIIAREKVNGTNA